MAPKFENIEQEYEFAQACAEYAVNKIAQKLDDDELFTDTVTKFTKEIVSLSKAGFACAIDNFKDILANKVHQFSDPDKDGHMHLKHQLLEKFAFIVTPILISEKGDDLLRGTLIQVLTDFHTLNSNCENKSYDSIIGGHFFIYKCVKR